MNSENILAYNKIVNKIHEIRGIKVMLDSDLAELYGVQTKVLNQAVQRNKQRFPKDFAFRLTQKEFSDSRSQIVTSSWGGRTYLPYVFTEHGILMLSSVLKSSIAAKVNIQIMRTFIAMREAILNYQQLQDKISELENKYDGQFQMIFKAIKQMLYEDETLNSRQIGFDTR